jgi:Tol biopolymer transport system component
MVVGAMRLVRSSLWTVRGRLALVVPVLVVLPTLAAVDATGVVVDHGERVNHIPEISAGGRYAVFDSAEPKLVPGDANRCDDVLLRDLATDELTLVSTAEDGRPVAGCSSSSMVTRDGRYVSFQSDAPNVVPGDTNHEVDMFVRDVRAGTTRRVSVASDGTQADSGSVAGMISADGTTVTFRSFASNLVPGDTNNTWDVFSHDLRTGRTTRVSVASDGTEGNDWSGDPQASADGRHVVFPSEASNLVPGDTNGASDVFVHDLETGETIRVSVPASEGRTGPGREANGRSVGHGIDSTGRYVAFSSEADNLVPGDTNAHEDVFLRDLREDTLVRASVGSSGEQADGPSEYPSVGDGGRWVAFTTYSGNLVDGDREDSSHILVRDLREHTTIVADATPEGTIGNGRVEYPMMARESPVVVFAATADNLVAGDHNGSWDVFVRDLAEGTIRIYSSPHGTASPPRCAWDDDDRAVGLPGHARGTGAVQVRLEGTGPQLLTRAGVGAGRGTPSDRFGAALTLTDLDASICASLVVGAPGADGSGRVYLVFGADRGLGGGSATVTVAPPAGQARAGDRFGAALALVHRRQGDLVGPPAAPAQQGELDLWVGAPGRDVAGHRDAGAVEHYHLSATSDPKQPVRVTHLETLTQDSPGMPGAAEAGDALGAVLAAADHPRHSRLVAGVPGEDLGRARDAGVVTVAHLDPHTGRREGRAVVLTQNTAGVAGVAEAGDRFGAAVATAVEELVVGVPGEDLGRTRDAGVVQEFRQAYSSPWAVQYIRTLHQNAPGSPGRAEAGDRFGAALALQGDCSISRRVYRIRPIVVVGVPGRDVNGRVDAGALWWRTLRLNEKPTLVWRGRGLPGQPVAHDRLGVGLATRFSLAREFSASAVSAGTPLRSGRSAVLLTWFVPPFATDDPADVLPIDAGGGSLPPVPATDITAV